MDLVIEKTAECLPLLFAAQKDLDPRKLSWDWALDSTYVDLHLEATSGATNAIKRVSFPVHHRDLRAALLELKDCVDAAASIAGGTPEQDYQGEPSDGAV